MPQTFSHLWINSPLLFMHLLQQHTQVWIGVNFLIFSPYYHLPSLDVALRKSSAQQLAIILQDPQWHEPLLQEHTDEVCMSILLEILDQGCSPALPRPHPVLGWSSSLLV
ncbi:hypothetical protein OS493_018583 [Desmophyllum pertusum]|uniref:Uncharacterized protein n=1 Tax=Desmophyllum pertusum TaxID=174260 RepID=A0A9X0D365_9CNID|nr:hypothetical protein OS493_018583 [Desmophyllum pertusum]